MHQVRSLSALDGTLCEYCQLSCFCVGCMEKFSRLLCTNKDHVDEWSLTRLRVVKPTLGARTKEEGRARTVEENRNSNIAADPEVPSEVIDDQLLPGYNVAVPTDLEDEAFWLLLVNKSPHVIKVDSVDHYGNTWKAGNLLLRGYFYERLQPSSCS
jgi:hypothetical protein